ncbi:MAG: class I poly(R)-hydroxyalkanoic acid synthase [Beijerinckiaceae bacterium]
MSVRRKRKGSHELRVGARPRPSGEASAKASGRRAAALETVAPAKPARIADAADGAPKLPAAAAAGAIPLPDFEKLSRNMARAVEEGQKAFAAYLKPIEQGQSQNQLANQVADAVTTLGHVAEHWLADPKRALEAQTRLTTDFIDLWGRTLKRMTGEAAESLVPPDPADKRFADPRWQELPFFDFLRQAYTLSSKWTEAIVAQTDDLDPRLRAKAAFYVRQITSALSPSNFLATNPELLYATAEANGENLARGMKMLAEDIAAGKGSLKIRQSDPTKFELGVNMAVTPGKVIWRNSLMELIQYSPATAEVYKRPLLIVPPWINKFYVLDLNPDKSFIRFAVEQGLTVFVISWVNPDERHADKGFEEYMREGIFEALDVIERATGERKTAAIGYCVGGTLLAIALAHMAATGDDRIESATFFTTQVDFTDAGDLQVFADAGMIDSVEATMAETGYLEGAKMATAFNMLRPGDLIWSYVVNNYLKGKEPMPFDLLTWNSDSTRMPRANHAFYLRNCYLENNLTRGAMKIGGITLDLGKVKIPVYNLATREDHIAPARSVFTGAKFFGGEMRYVLAGSGHIAGVVNPAWKPKYQYWTGKRPAGAFDDWMAEAEVHPGSWWTDWAAWVTGQAPERVPAREPGGGALPPLCDAPGEYVRMKA